MQFIKCGIPQGSVLGPVLFLLFINDICNVSNFLKFVLFADDTNIFCSNENVAVLQDTLNRELAKLFVWFSINKLSLNLGKTNYMLFRGRPPDLELHLKINNADIPKVTATKFLGIVIDNRLNWKPHIKSVKSKLSSILSIFHIYVCVCVCVRACVSACVRVSFQAYTRHHLWSNRNQIWRTHANSPRKGSGQNKKLPRT